MIAREPISQLADSLRRARTGEATNAEVVRWLRAVSSIAVSVPMPKICDRQRGYTRTLLHKSDAFEILALHWLPDCTTSIHDHGGAHCWLAVSSGTMGIENYLRYDSGEVQGYAQIGFQGREELREGAIDYRQDDVHLHRCIARDACVTLHVYAHPIEQFHAFDERAHTCSVVTSTYDAIL